MARISPTDLLDDDYERDRLNKYVDLAGIESFEEFKKRVKEGFNSVSGKNFLKNLTNKDLKAWYDNEQKKITKFFDEKPTKPHKKRNKDDRVHYFGYEHGKPVGIVKKEFVEIKGVKHARYRASNGRFTSIKK